MVDMDCLDRPPQGKGEVGVGGVVGGGGSDGLIAGGLSQDPQRA